MVIPPDNSDRLAVDLAAAAEAVGLGLTKLRECADAGEFPTFRVGRRRLVRVEALNEWLRVLEVAPSDGVPSDGSGFAARQ